MKKFEMPEVQVITFEEEILSGVEYLSGNAYIANVEDNFKESTGTFL